MVILNHATVSLLFTADITVTIDRLPNVHLDVCLGVHGVYLDVHLEIHHDPVRIMGVNLYGHLDNNVELFDKSCGLP